MKAPCSRAACWCIEYTNEGARARTSDTSSAAVHARARRCLDADRGLRCRGLRERFARPVRRDLRGSTLSRSRLRKSARVSGRAHARPTPRRRRRTCSRAAGLDADRCRGLRERFVSPAARSQSLDVVEEPAAQFGKSEGGHARASDASPAASLARTRRWFGCRPRQMRCRGLRERFVRPVRAAWWEAHWRCNRLAGVT